jgi:hypothetical protein
MEPFELAMGGGSYGACVFISEGPLVNITFNPRSDDCPSVFYPRINFIIPISEVKRLKQLLEDVIENYNARVSRNGCK